MVRAMQNLDLRSNLHLCGNDTPFCYPVSDVGDISFYYKIPEGYELIKSISLYPMDFNGPFYWIFYNLGNLNQFFSYVIATDSNGDNFVVIRAMQPFYNYDGITPEITCFSLGVTMINAALDEFTFGTEPVCYVAKRTMEHYTIQIDPGDVSLLHVFITCPGETESTEYTYETLPSGYWIELTGPFVDLFIPEGCVLDDAKIGGYSQTIGGPIQQEFGAQSCLTYAKITGNGKFRYDCFGRYFGTLLEEDIINDNVPGLILNADSQLDLANFPVLIQSGEAKRLANRSTPKRVSPSCYIPDNEWFNRYKISGNCAVPWWFVEEVNNVASTQRVLISGSVPVTDDYDVLIPVVQSDEYNWKERGRGSNMFFPQLYFESCVCYRNFVC